jgi:hypothetical protein
MRTTLTLDDDVAALLARVQKEKDVTMRDAVNEALRRGLASMSEPPQPKEPFRTPALDLGPSFFPNLDNTWKIIEEVEGPFARLL